MVDSQKIDKLRDLILKMKSVLVAYSGGVDSTLVLKLAFDALGEKSLAVTAKSLLYPAGELEAAKNIARGIGARHLIFESNELRLPGFAKNPKNRCYICKRELFSHLVYMAREGGLNYILDGSNASDSADFRPGKQAACEFGIRSVLEEVGLTKDEVRELSRRLDLPNYNKPSAACLASRFPYGKRITARALRMVEEAEAHIRKLGISQVRTRHYGNLCRIEVGKCQMHLLLDKQDEVTDKLKKLGYTYVTLDLEGYRTGSMNE